MFKCTVKRLKDSLSTKAYNWIEMNFYSILVCEITEKKHFKYLFLGPAA